MFRFCGLFCGSSNPNEGGQPSFSEAEIKSLEGQFGPARRIMNQADGSQIDVGWLQYMQNKGKNGAVRPSFGPSEIISLRQQILFEYDARFGDHSGPNTMNRK